MPATGTPGGGSGSQLLAQYNGVALGLSLLAVYCIARGAAAPPCRQRAGWGALTLFAAGHELLGAASYCLALAFKHIAAYFAPAFFTFLLVRALQRPRWSARLARIAAVRRRPSALSPFLPATHA